MPDTAALDDMVLNLSDLQIIKSKPKVEDYFDLQFVNAFNNSHGNAKE
jgi:hypothetical protein